MVAKPEQSGEQDPAYRATRHLTPRRVISQRCADKPIADKSTNEFIISLECESAEIVTQLSEKAFAQGARRLNDPEDQDFMFSWGFEDLDGHVWDLFWLKG